MTDRLVVDLDAMPLTWPLDEDALEDLRWYLEDYLTAPFGVYGNRGSGVEARLADWGRAVYWAVLGSAAVQGDTELVLRSSSPSLLSLPWELMVAPGHAMPAALDLAGVSRSLAMAGDAQAVPVPGGKLRVLMVISRPARAADVGYRMIARPLLERLEAVRGAVEVVVLRPPTLDALRAELTAAAAAGRPYQVVHFDGHGEMFYGEGALAFESASGGEDRVRAARIAEVLGDAAVPVVVLNACQSGAVGMDLEAAVATALLRDGVASVVAMAYRVYPVAAAEFMAAFYEQLFAGGTVGSAVTAGRQQLYRSPRRPSPKGELPLADWLVPVHYVRREVSFPQAVLPRPAESPSLADALAELTVAAGGAEAGRLGCGRRRLRRPGCAVLRPRGGGSAAEGRRPSRTGRDGQDRAGEGVRPVVARHRWGRPAGWGVLALVRAWHGVVRPGRRDHRDRPSTIWFRLRAAG